MKALIIILILLFPMYLFAQTLNINLSPKHQQKLSGIESGHKRMVKFYKYYKKDSARYVKKLNRQQKKTLDSAFLAEAARTKEQALAVHVPDSLELATAFNEHLQKWQDILKDTAATDSAKAIAKEQIKQLVIERARQYPGFQHLEEQYKLLGDSVSWEALVNQVPELDTLKSLFEADPQNLFQHAEKLAEQHLMGQTGAGSLMAEFGKVEDIKSLPEQYKSQYEGYLSKNDELSKMGKDEVAEKALEYFAENPEKLEAAQQRISKLLSKYRSFSNSATLADAKKHTSMEGKTFFERLVMGGNFNVLSTSPVSLDLSPQLGYKFTSKLFVGIGMNYRVTFSDSIKHSWYVSPANTAFKAFVSYDIVKSWYAYVEGEWSGIRKQVNGNEQGGHTSWQANYFIGGGRRFLIHPKLYMTLTALYNLNNEFHNPLYPRRFQVRVGFQLSELATRKKQVNYDPNR